MSISRRLAAVLLAGVVGMASACTAAPSAPTPTPSTQELGAPAASPSRVQVGLKVLVLDDDSAMSEALIQAMARAGTPFDRILLTERRREPLTSSRLATVDAAGVTAHYAGIIAPGVDDPTLTPAERTVLAAYRDAFGVRVIRTRTDTIPAGQVGSPGPEIRLDGTVATVTPEAHGSSFAYLRDSLAFDPAGGGTASIGTPPTATPSAGYVPLLTVPLPGQGTRQGALLGVRTQQGREEMLVHFEGHAEQSQVQVLAPGMLGWLTRGLGTSLTRNWFSVHSDDILLPNSQWSVEGHCEIGRNCPPDVPQLDPIRMTAEDITFLVDWQRARNLKIDIAFNGAGAGEHAQAHGGRDPLMEEMAAQTQDIRLLNHTWGHLFLGCHQLVTPDDWRCAGDANGQTLWRTQEELRDQIAMNQAFAEKNDLAHFDPAELVTGEHSGLAKPPRQMTDNPHLAAALTETGITWVASDASDEADPRRIGSATTVPRHPIDLEFNAATARQVASEHNWRLTRRADGGSGACETDPTSECVQPVDLDTGFTDVIVPAEADKAYLNTIANDPRPHFAHQSNMTADRVLYPVLDAVLQRYHATFSETAPLLNPTMGRAGQELVDQQAWAAASGSVEATVSNGLVRISNRGTADARVPLTLPEGSVDVTQGRQGGPFGEAYAGARSRWVDVPAGSVATFQVPTEGGFPADAAWPVEGVG